MIDVSRQDEMPTRDQALWPYVEKLRIWSSLSAENEAGGKEIEFRVGASTLIVDAWEQRQMRAHFRETPPDERDLDIDAEDPNGNGGPRREPAPNPDAARLTSLALALVTKILGDIEELRIAVDHRERVFRVQAELMLDVAMSRALIGEVQSEVEGSVRNGQVENAKCLTDLRHKLQRAAEIARSRIAKAEGQLAEFRSARILEDSPDCPDETAEPESTPRKSGEMLEELSPAEMLREAHRHERDARLRVRQARLAKLQSALPTSTGTLTLAFSIALAAWVAMAYLPSLRQNVRPVPVLSAQDFRSTVGDLFRGWVAQPPSLYLEVDGLRWSELSQVERSVALEEIAGRAAVLGYNGLIVTDGEGRPRAQWLRERGVLVYPDPPEGLSASPAAGTQEP